nr:type I-D CRISPR-associated protein Cas7/Csc2 [Candidatus Sigynarchaeota archaeon]
MNLESKELKTICSKNGLDLDKFCTNKLEENAYKNQPTETYIHFVVLEELQDYAIFTQDGTSILAKETVDVIGGKDRITRGVQFMRKMTATLRRKSKSLLRTYAPTVVDLGDGVLAGTKRLSKVDPDDGLFGFAVGEEGNEDGVAFAGKSRVKTSSSFTIRPLDKGIAQFITFNAQSDDLRIPKASTALGEKEYFLPETVFPSIITLQDPTKEDIAYMVYVISKTSHAGAVSTRTGKVQLHLIGVIFNHEELPSNLALSQWLYNKIGKKAELPPIADLKKSTMEGIADLCKQSSIDSGKIIAGDAILNAVLGDVFQSEEKTAKWIGIYANLYKKILVKLDFKNAELSGKKKDERQKIVDKITKECDDKIKSLSSA